MGKGIWGIDVSKYSVKAVRLEEAGATGVLTRTAVIPFESTGGEEQANHDDQVKAALADLKNNYKVGGEPVVFSLPSHSTFNRLIKLPPVDDAKIPEIVKYEAQSQIPFNIDEVIWDYQYVDRQYATGEEKEVILFAIKRDIVEQFLGNIADLGFNVDAVQFGPVALFNFLLHDQDLGAASVALDMGGDNTDLIVLDGTKFWVRNLPITGNDITKALQKAFNIPFAEAEKLKLKAGQSQQAQKIFNAIQPVLRDLVNEINRSTGYYKSISKTSKFEKIILLGNSTKTLNFQKFVSQSLQLPAARVQKLNKLQVAGGVDAGELTENLTTIGTAMGLALQGLGLTVNRVNLLPPAYVRRKELAKKKPFVVATAAALYVLVGLMWFTGDAEVTKLKTTSDRAKTIARDLDSWRKEFDNTKKVEPIRQAVEEVAGVSSERDLILKIMDEINPNIPRNGEPTLAEDQKLWVVDWKFKEVTRTQPGAPPPPPPAPGTPPGGEAPAPPKPAEQRLLQAVIEVCITKRKEVGLGSDYIVRTLLNYEAGSRRLVNTAKPCVVKTKHWELSATDRMSPTGFWQVEPEAGELERPIPSHLSQPGNPFGQPQNPDQEKPYARFRVTVEVPVGAEARKAAESKPGERK